MTSLNQTLVINKSQRLFQKEFSHHENILLKNISCLLTFSSLGNANSGENISNSVEGQKNYDIFISQGKVHSIEKNSTKNTEFLKKSFENIYELNCENLVVMPALVDSHTHSIFSGSRAKETVLKSQGMSYEQIYKQGGGILSSCHQTRKCPKEDLKIQFEENLHDSLCRGVVLCESKTGYGLNIEHEIDFFKLMCEPSRSPFLPYLQATYMPLHAQSPEVPNNAEYVTLATKSLHTVRDIYIANKNLNPFLISHAVDIFIERDYFTKEQGGSFLNAALSLGINVHIHADEFSHSGGSVLACELAESFMQNSFQNKKNTSGAISSVGKVLSVDHCQFAKTADIKKLHHFGITPVALPSTSFFSGIPFVNADKWRIEGGSDLLSKANYCTHAAIASDFNPGSAPINSLWFAAYLALTKCHFNVLEVLHGITHFAAQALGAEESFGTIDVGRPAHLIAFKGNTAEDFFATADGSHLQYVLRS
jgi:imidazolonepropionase